jgi:hypothetical protein
MRILRLSFVVLLSLLSVVSAAGASRSAQTTAATCPGGTCTLFLPMTSSGGAPILRSPEKDAVITSLAPVLEWGAQSFGTHTIQVTTDASFSTPSTMVLSSTKTIRTTSSPVVDTPLLSNLKAETTYFWRVGVALPQGMIYSPVYAFTTPAKTAVQLPGVVQIIAPANNAIVHNKRVLLNWSPVPGALAYRIRMYDSTGASFSPGSTQVAAPQTTFWVEDVPRGTYTWKIRAYNQFGWGGYSDIYTIYVAP